MPFNLGPMEMVFVMVVLLLIFGAKRLPELGSGLGKGIREFKRTMRDMESSVTEQVAAPAAPAELPRQGAWAHVQPPAPVAEAVPAPAAFAPGPVAPAMPAPAAPQPAAAPLASTDQHV